MNTILKYNLDDLMRYMLGIMCIILCLRILLVPEAIENYRLFGVADIVRQIMGIGGFVAISLFVYDKTILIGGALLLLGIGFAMYHHVNVGQTIAWLIVLGVGILLGMLFAYKRRSWVEK